LARQFRKKTVAFGVLAVVCALTLSACGQLDQTNPRLRSVAAQEPEATPTPAATDVTDPSVEPSVDPTSTPTSTPSTPKGPPPCPAGKYQLEIEQALAKIGSYGPITVDGVQSKQDCTTIANFQKRMGIGMWQGQRTDDEAPNGTPGKTTRDVAVRIAATDTSQCPLSDHPQACVDLTHQTFYVVSQGQVILGPTVTRTGKPGFRTPSGKFHVIWRSLKAWSNPYSVWLPYWQNFYGGDGLHETTTYIHNTAIGSHGCVNLLHDDAKLAYELLDGKSTVYLYGRRPGT
jgi:lipoprotein-anchoring transpeptidase ErfK/SrfK